MQPSGEPLVSLPSAPMKSAGDGGPPMPTPAAPDPPIPSAPGAPGVPTAAAPPAPAPAPVSPALPAGTPAEELDVWWGSYWGWTLWPSMAACVLLTGAIGLGTWLWVSRDVMQWVFLGLAGGLWLAQGTRWAYRFFGFNYRLTTLRLFRDKGFLYPEFVQISLTTLARVEVRRNALEQLARVGRIYLHFLDAALPPVVLEGVRHPHAVAEMIEQWRDTAKESSEGKAAANP